ncbi:hypothetical protein HYT26_03280 [Candidatus Pacearchaeota archaeon]|nr:hypothetical protein [Candidatus Pacearchaeota archaeon]
MARQDIVSGLRNAVERGYSIDVAISSFVNSGYKKEEVAEAAAYVGDLAAIAPQKTIIPQIPAMPNAIQGTPTETIPQPIEAVQQKQKKSRKALIIVIILSIILLSLIGVLAYLIFFKRLFA